MACLSTRPPPHVKHNNSPGARIPPTAVLLHMCCNFQEIRQVHAQLLVSGLLRHPPNAAARLVEPWVRVLHIYYAMSVFNTIPSPHVFAYDTIIRGLMLGKDILPLNGIIPNNYTYTFVLKACSQLKALFEAKQVHCQMIKAGKAAPYTYSHSSLIRMYTCSGSIDCAVAKRVLSYLIITQENITSTTVIAKNAMISGYLSQGQLDKARAMLDKMVAKDVAFWSAMISGYTDNAMYAEALSIFGEMMASRVSLNESTLVRSLVYCAPLEALD
ncbi:Pentatricopeptide repeat [Parasponia andersonii]|uniref:Pentatricopeptide repeat n=1 Tax=Parasponia andersonii TaxID=3476 RepID=A0A2P5BEI6_PARAD|nr:Pentatricopeptide repeat [Parasponia andersonii]